MKIGGAEFGAAKTKRYVRMLLTHPFLFLVRFFSYGMLRSKHIWAFGHPTKFEGNSKYFFLYTQNTKPKDVTSIWISRDPNIVKELQEHGYNAALAHSVKGMWYILRAKYFVVDTSVEVIHYWLSGGGQVVNLFHALPIKKMERDVEKGESTEVLLFHSKGVIKTLMHFLFPWRFVKPKYVASTSPLYTKIFSSMFRISENKIKEVGFPRNDVLLKDIRGAGIGVDKKAFEKMEQWKGKVVLYAPTFRDTGDTSFLEEHDKMQKLNELMQKHNALFVLKLHPFMSVTMHKDEYSNIFHAVAATDSYPLLRLTDILITDYSSIFVDFLLLDRPEIFFAYDLEKYMTRDRELYFEYEDFTPGLKAKTFDEFLKVLENTIQGNDEMKEFRKKQQRLCFSKVDAEAAARTFQFLQNA